MTTPVRFSLEDAQTAAGGHFNCGPASLCAVSDLMPNDVLPHLRNFDKKHYTNPLMMKQALDTLDIPFDRVFECRGHDHPKNPIYPVFGLVRVQWDGPWFLPGVPVRASYRHTHWVAWDSAFNRVFDINAMCVGGWLPKKEWRELLVPWLLSQIEPTATGLWWPTHCWQIKRPLL